MERDNPAEKIVQSLSVSYGSTQFWRPKCIYGDPECLDTCMALAHAGDLIRMGERRSQVKKALKMHGCQAVLLAVDDAFNKNGNGENSGDRDVMRAEIAALEKQKMEILCGLGEKVATGEQRKKLKRLRSAIGARRANARTGK